jgi:hypothetical protein
MLPGVCELALQKLRLDLHCLLKVCCLNQFPRIVECSLDVLFGKRQCMLEISVGGLGIDVNDLLAASKNISNAFSA